MENSEFILFAKKPTMLHVGRVIPFLVFIFLYIKGWDFVNNLVFTIIFYLVYYYSFLRYSCRIYISKEAFKVNYVAPWLADKYIATNSIAKIDYLVSFWDMEESQKKSRNFKNICYDTIILYMRNGTVEEVNINTRMSYFHKVLKYINKSI